MTGEHGKGRRVVVPTRRDLALAGLVLAGTAMMAAWRRRRPEPPRLPTGVKFAHAALLTVLVPYYVRRHGPDNFLWFSDLALFETHAALWLEDPLPSSLAAVSVLPLELGWNADFLAGGRLTGLAGYMFEPERPLVSRAMSLFHVPMPALLLYLLHRFGYDRRALALQVATAWVVLPATLALTRPGKNVNWVFGSNRRRRDAAPRTAALMAGLPLLYLATHAALARCFRPAR